MRTTIYLDQAKEAFEEIQSSFPRLNMDMNYNQRYLDLAMDIPKQSGLDFDVSLNLQDDELHISASGFWGSYFPMKDPIVITAYLEAVKGILSGEYRILQSMKNGMVITSFLQRPNEGSWETIFTDRRKWKWPWIKYEQRIIKNKR